MALHTPDSAWVKGVGWLFRTGILLFSGSLYLPSLSGVRWLGAITPLGGTAFIIGWLVLTVGGGEVALKESQKRFTAEVAERAQKDFSRYGQDLNPFHCKGAKDAKERPFLAQFKNDLPRSLLYCRKLCGKMYLVFAFNAVVKKGAS